MASRVAKFFSTKPVSAIVCSPLQRTRETAAPLESATKITASIDDRVVEGRNEFQGSRVSVGKILRNPRLWPLLRNPLLPSWAEPYSSIASRMMEAIEDAANSVDTGDVVIVTHQLPIWMVHRHVAGVPLPHFPTSRRCTLASVTTLSRVSGQWKEQDYQEPAQDLLVDAIDLGAV